MLTIGALSVAPSEPAREDLPLPPKPEIAITAGVGKDFIFWVKSAGTFISEVYQNPMSAPQTILATTFEAIQNPIQ